jgi:hypothetical protein
MSGQRGRPAILDCFAVTVMKGCASSCCNKFFHSYAALNRRTGGGGLY